MAWTQIDNGSGQYVWLNSDTGLTQPDPPTPQQLSSASGIYGKGSTPLPQGQTPAGTVTAAPTAAPANTGTANGPPGSTTIGYNGQTGLAGTQQPGIFGTGTYISNPYGINDPAITGLPTQGASTDYGLNGISQNLTQATNGLRMGNYNATAPTSQAAQGYAATGTAAQGQGASAQAATGGPASFSAALGNATTGTSSNMAATYGNQAASGQAAQGLGSYMGASAGQGALGQATYGNAAQMNAASGGYATGGPATISTAGDAQWQAQQGALAGQLGLTANGGGVSPADLQLAQGTQQGLAAQLAALGSQRGNTGNAALAARSAADAGVQGQQALNQNMGIQRAQETLAAQQALGSVLGTARGQAQSYNANQAQLAQQSGQQNVSNAQQALQANAGYAQQAATVNQGALQSSMLANQNAANAMTGQNMSNLQGMDLANLGYSQGANQFNAGQAQNAMLANLGAQNTQLGQNVGLAQGLNQANLGYANNASQVNAQQNQAMTLANMQQQQAMTGLNMGYQNTANQGNANLSQGMNLANLSAENAMTSQNSAQAQAMAQANLNAQNQFGLTNVENSQAMGLANLGNQQQTNLANQTQAGAFGLANQQAQLAANQNYYSNLLGLSGASTGIAQSNRSAQLANQQLQVQQQIATNQTNEQAYQASAQNNANLAGAVFGGVGAVGAATITALGKNASGQTVYSNGSGYTSTDPTDPGLYQDSPLGTTNSQPVNGFTVSDENLKAGIQGGNPMLASFLDQVKQDDYTPATINASAGESFRDPTMVRSTTPATSTGNPSAGIDSTADTIFGMVPGIGPLLSLGLKAAQSGLYQGSSSGGGTTTQTIPGSGNTQFAPITDADSSATLSDDQQKENIISGNAGMQQFLEQANAQQSAQNTQGSTNNSFMQMGQAPSNQVDRQLPQMQNPNFGYGGGTGMGGMGYGYGGAVDQGNETPGSVYGGGITQGGGVTNNGYSTIGGLSQNASMNAGGGMTGGGATQGTTSGGGMSTLGGYNAGYAQGQQGFNPGGVVQGATMNGAGISNPGGFTPGSNASQPQPAPMNAPPPPQALPPAPYQTSPTLISKQAPSVAVVQTPPAQVQSKPSLTQRAAPTAAVVTPTSPLIHTAKTPVAPLPALGPMTVNSQPIQPVAQPMIPAAKVSPFRQPPIIPTVTPTATASQNEYPAQADNAAAQQAALLAGQQGASQMAQNSAANQAFAQLQAQQAAAAQAANPLQLGMSQDAFFNSFDTSSDEENKTEVSDDPGGVTNMLDKLQAHQYRYKNPAAPGAGPGTFVSPMAQELEKTDLGKSFVKNTPQGKMVDYGHMAGTMLAGEAMLHERVSKLEQLLKARRMA